jgi:competence protein ComEA
MKKKRISVVESGYSSAQRKGIIFLLALTVSGMYFFNWLFKPNVTEEINIEEYTCLMDSLTVYGEYKSYPKSNYTDKKSARSKNYRRATFYFNPNTCSSDSLALLGFSPSVIKSVINYRTKGGVIYNFEKFKKMYGVDSVQLRELEKWMVFPEKVKHKNNDHTTGKNKIYTTRAEEKIRVELNIADSISLTRIKGIGAFWASRIIRTRKNCGGFSSLEEIRENAWLPDSILQIIQPFIYVDPVNMPRIEINTADYKTLIRQPYFDRKKVQILLKYRESHGPFRELNDLRKIAAFDEHFYRKISTHFYIGH